MNIKKALYATFILVVGIGIVLMGISFVALVVNSTYSSACQLMFAVVLIAVFITWAWKTIYDNI